MKLKGVCVAKLSADEWWVRKMTEIFHENNIFCIMIFNKTNIEGYKMKNILVNWDAKLIT